MDEDERNRNEEFGRTGSAVRLMFHQPLFLVCRPSQPVMPVDSIPNPQFAKNKVHSCVAAFQVRKTLPEKEEGGKEGGKTLGAFLN